MQALPLASPSKARQGSRSGRLGQLRKTYRVTSPAGRFAKAAGRWLAPSGAGGGKIFSALLAECEKACTFVLPIRFRVGFAPAGGGDSEGKNLPGCLPVRKRFLPLRSRLGKGVLVGRSGKESEKSFCGYKKVFLPLRSLT